MRSGVAELLFPTRCLACSARGPRLWCEACQADVVRPADVCRRCAAPRRRGHPCWPQGAPLDATRAVFDYRAAVARGIRTAKLGGAHRAWSDLGALVAEALVADPVPADVVTWVPTPRRRARQRDGDHARMLAAAVADGLNLPLEGLLRDAPAPGGDGDRYRFGFSWHLPGSDIVLVDDVVTTGRTAMRAAGVLRRAGAGRITLAVVARAGAHPLGG